MPLLKPPKVVMSKLSSSQPAATVLVACTSAKTVGLPLPSGGEVESSSFSKMGVPARGDHTFTLMVVPPEKSMPPARFRLAPAHTWAPASLVMRTTLPLVLMPEASGLAITEAGIGPKLADPKPFQV